MEKKLLTEKEIKNYMWKIVGSRKCDILDHYVVPADDADEFHCETEVIRVRPKNPSFNINSKYLKYIDNLSTACVDIPVSQNLRFMIQLNKK
uniref:Uncharacterized protein n=1 Tax=viral metagenome TaxID=1070528 RepID=A0A6M3X5L9_9ZZZZ